jgi:hypothetical protein
MSEENIRKNKETIVGSYIHKISLFWIKYLFCCIFQYLNEKNLLKNSIKKKKLMIETDFSDKKYRYWCQGYFHQNKKIAKITKYIYFFK